MKKKWEFQNSENGVHSCFHSENWKVSPTTTMPVQQINMEVLESRFLISDSDLSINPFVQSSELTKLFHMIHS